MKKIFRLFLLTFILCMVAGCKEETQENEYRDQNIDIYYINRDETTIRSEKYEIQSSDISNAIEEVLAKMKEASFKTRKPLLRCLKQSLWKSSFASVFTPSRILRVTR